MGGLLNGVKVVDLTWHISGPYCTKLLADCGADVIKVEKPGDGDTSRKVGPFPDNKPDSEKSALYLYLNTGKKSVTLDLKSEFGKKTVKELVKSADILVENFSPSVMPDLGLDYETLEKINPKLVMVSISNFGQTGPYRDFKADENVLHAMGGLTATTGDEALPPVRQGGYQAQYIGGLHAFTATMIAFHCQQVAGIGQHVDQSIMEAWAYHSNFPGYQFTGRIRGQMGSLESAVFGIYPTSDGYCGLAAGSQPDWESLKGVINNPALDDPRFADAGGRWQYSDELIALIMSWTTDHTKREVYDALQQNGVAAGMVVETCDLLNDPQLKSRQYLAEINHPVAGKLVYPTISAKFSESTCQIRRAPLLGEHNEEIYCNRLGYSREDLVKLKQLATI